MGFNSDKYAIVFEFFFQGEWYREILTKSGNGYTFYEANYISQEMNGRKGVRNAHWIEYRR